MFFPKSKVSDKIRIACIILVMSLEKRLIESCKEVLIAYVSESFCDKDSIGATFSSGYYPPFMSI
jgi:hypothetical protein